MRKIRLSELNDAVRAFLADVGADQSVVIEDDQGRIRYGITPYARSTQAERQRAWKDLEQIQLKVADSMQRQGITESDVMDELLRDD